MLFRSGVLRKGRKGGMNEGRKRKGGRERERHDDDLDSDFAKRRDWFCDGVSSRLNDRVILIGIIFCLPCREIR